MFRRPLPVTTDHPRLSRTGDARDAFWSEIAFLVAAEPAPLVGPEVAGAYREGDLAALAAATRRAGRGLAYSQVLVASRARNAFLERARLATGLSPEAMRELQRDPVALQRMFHDDVIQDFTHLDIGDLEERYRWVVEARERGGFAREFEDVLKRMEAWK